MWWLYALLSAFFASLTAIFTKMGLSHVNSNVATAIRTAVVLLMICGILMARGELKETHSINRQAWVFLGISGIATGLSWIFYFKALQMGKVSEVAAVDKLSLALTILLSATFLGETPNLKTLVGAGLIIAGTLVLIYR